MSSLGLATGWFGSAGYDAHLDLATIQHGSRDLTHRRAMTTSDCADLDSEWQRKGATLSERTARKELKSYAVISTRYLSPARTS